MKEIEELREKVSDIDFTVNVKTAKIATHENYHQEMFKRMESVENTVDELVKTTINLEFVKCEKALYEEEMGAVKQALKGHDAELFEMQNASHTLENYMEKY